MIWRIMFNEKKKDVGLMGSTLEETSSCAGNRLIMFSTLKIS